MRPAAPAQQPLKLRENRSLRSHSRIKYSERVANNSRCTYAVRCIFLSNSNLYLHCIVNYREVLNGNDSRARGQVVESCAILHGLKLLIISAVPCCTGPTRSVQSSSLPPTMPPGMMQYSSTASSNAALEATFDISSTVLATLATAAQFTPLPFLQEASLLALEILNMVRVSIGFQVCNSMQLF